MHDDTIPPLPKELKEPSTRETILYLLYGLTLAYAPGLLASNIWDLPVSLTIKILTIAFLTVVAGYGFFAVGASGHEGFHFTLHRNRHVSAATGAFFSSVVPSFFAVGFFAIHWQHHRYTNTDQDPDVHFLQRFRTFLSRGLLGRLAFNRRYLAWTFSILRGEAVVNAPLSAREFRFLAWVNLAAQMFWLAVYTVLIVLAPKTMVFVLALPLVVMLFISGLNPYLEHAGTELTRGANARTRSSTILTLLTTGVNYHLEHHLYPSVPVWRLARVHRWLKKQGWFENRKTFVEPSFLKSFRYAMVSVPYSIAANGVYPLPAAKVHGTSTWLLSNRAAEADAVTQASVSRDTPYGRF